MNWNQNSGDPHRYDDMLSLPHHVSKTHPRMARLDRAAQFAPFAALTGLDDAMDETARLTEGKLELADNALAELDGVLRRLMERREERPALSVTFFEPDDRKAGGAYRTIRGELLNVDPLSGTLVLADRTKISLEDILDIREE